jgi:hypothetical protein|tara:strand:+ start:494 stop:1405 length:912 start_codon:yes stop_codon:yes gene_type:complete
MEKNMNNNIATIDTDNFAIMSQSMGMTADVSQKKQTSTLNRLKISHSPIMGEVEVKGKKTQAALVNGGVYKLDDLENDTSYYSDTVTIRPYIQRFMYKKYVKPDNENGFYVKTVMSEGLNNDLKDNMGGFNCGKPAGFIKDYNALPEKTKQIIKGIKRVRAIFGTVVLNNPVDARGEDIVMDKSIPFIWEIDNRDAFKIMGVPIAKMHGWKHILPQHNIECATEKRDLPNGNSFYLPTADVTNNVLDITDEQHKLFEEFVQWIKNYNEYIFKTWTDKRESELTDEEANTVNEFVDVELESDAK